MRLLRQLSRLDKSELDPTYHAVLGKGYCVKQFGQYQFLFSHKPSWVKSYKRVSLPLSCELTATQFLSACRILGKDQTSQRNPANKENKCHFYAHVLLNWTPANELTLAYLVIQFPCFHLKIHHPVVFYFFSADLQSRQQTQGKGFFL